MCMQLIVAKWPLRRMLICRLLRWVSWCDGTGDISFAFVSAEERGMMAAQFHAQLLLRGLQLFEVDELLHRAPPTFEQHEILLKMALFEKTYC